MRIETKHEYWNSMVPELIVEDIEISKNFYLLMGFSVKFERKENKFVYLELGQVQLMLEEATDNLWITEKLEKPFGRGINLQMEVENMEEQLKRISTNKIQLYKNVTESWYRVGELENGQREFLIQDPDGYLLRFCEFIGEREISA